MSHHFLTVQNDAEGQAFLKQLRKHLRPTPNRAVIRGRGPRPRGYKSHLPKRLSTHFRVYIQSKPKDKWVKVVDLSAPSGRRDVLQPTKWHPRFEELTSA